MKVNILYDDRRFEKYEPLMDELKRQGIDDYEFHEPVFDKNITTVQSINLSHKKIVQAAKDNGDKRCCIMEDDCYFPSINGWRYYLDNMPNSFDLYLAATYILPISNNKVCGFHLYTIDEKFYDKFLLVPDTEHIDTAMDGLMGDYKFCYPFPALQRSGWSSNNMSVVNYNVVLTEKDIYNG